LDYILLGSGSTKTPLQKRFKEIDGQLLEKKGLCGRFRHYLVDCSIFPPDYDYLLPVNSGSKSTPPQVELSPAQPSPFLFSDRALLQVLYSRKRCNNSLVNLHIKNPTALTMKDIIVKVSTLTQSVKCDRVRGNHSG
jgi:hypothetical protein